MRKKSNFIFTHRLRNKLFKVKKLCFYLWSQCFCSPYFTAEFRPHSQRKIGSFFPKLIRVIVSKNPDLVTVSRNVFLYYAIIYPVICTLFITVFCTRSSFFFYINMSHNSHSPREVFQSVHTDQALLQTFPNVYKLLYLMNIIPASVERSFSYMNMIKTPLRSRLTQRNLEALMRISMEGNDKLPDSVRSWHISTQIQK